MISSCITLYGCQKHTDPIKHCQLSYFRKGFIAGCDACRSKWKYYSTRPSILQNEFRFHVLKKQLNITDASAGKNRRVDHASSLFWNKTKHSSLFKHCKLVLLLARSVAFMASVVFLKLTCTEKTIYRNNKRALTFTVSFIAKNTLPFCTFRIIFGDRMHLM